MRPADLGVALVVVLGAAGCKDTAKISIEHARGHVAFLAETAAKDVEEVRAGLPAGAEVVGSWWKTQSLESDLKAAQDSLEAARRKVQELRIAKSTFFALVDLNGNVIRNDQEQDRMAGKALFAAFPALPEAKNRYFETQGSLPEASGVRAPRADGQWIAGTPVRVDGVAKGLYVTGWAWTSYAYRLEFALRGRIRSELKDKREENEPLLYVYVVVGKAAFGAPVSPEVNATEIGKLDPLGKARGAEPFVERIEIEGRSFGLAVRRTPILGEGVGIAVLRSET
jgi:hypothetical protein